MAKEEPIKVNGTILEALRNGEFRVKIDGTNRKTIVRAHLSGRMRRANISIMPGDRVEMEMSPYDLTMGRIVWRGEHDKE